MNRLDDAVEIRLDVRVPESEDSESGPRKDRVTHSVVIALDFVAMLAAVHLDDQVVLEADEVQEEAQQRRLTAKMKTFGAQGS